MWVSYHYCYFYYFLQENQATVSNDSSDQPYDALGLTFLHLHAQYYFSVQLKFVSAVFVAQK